MMSVAPHVAERIRRPMPSGLSVLPGSLPVVSFGDPDRATVATLSLNPSWIEFESSSGAWLHGADRRLASLISLGIDDARELDDDRVAQVVTESNAYFRGPNWYRAWFHWLESLLTSSGAGSYMDGSACHLDLVQWATKPAQGELQAEVWNRLVEQDADFLEWQLHNSNVSTVLCNGSSVVRWLRQARLVDDFEQEVLSYQGAKGSSRIRVFRAITDGVLFVGWNKPLAGAIATEGRLRLHSWVGQIILDRIPENAPDGEGPLPDQKGASPNSDLVDSDVPIGTAVSGASELQRVLSRWIQASTASTVGDVGAYGGSPVIVVRMGTDEFVLNRDTKRAAVETFLSAAVRTGGATNLRWHVTANVKGKLNRVTYRDDDEPTPGWFAYLRKPSPEPRDLR